MPIVLNGLIFLLPSCSFYFLLFTLALPISFFCLPSVSLCLSLPVSLFRMSSLFLVIMPMIHECLSWFCSIAQWKGKTEAELGVFLINGLLIRQTHTDKGTNTHAHVPPLRTVLTIPSSNFHVPSCTFIIRSFCESWIEVQAVTLSILPLRSLWQACLQAIFVERLFLRVVPWQQK